MEHVEGEDLSQRIARGAIPLDEALPIAKQIAEALEAAHEQGIIHRDLKPANIEVRVDGTVKVLDFGLAKAMEPTGVIPRGQSRAPTITTPAMTQAGLILGTAAYMSPEQARGKLVDKRADIWAFGCVLHEMLTGRRVFDGDEVSDTMAFVLTKDPDWSALPADTPAAIRRLLRRCLVKDRSHRLPDIGSARLDIDEARTEAPPAPIDSRVSEPRGAAVRRAAAWATGAVALAALSSLVVWMAMRAQPADHAVTRVLIGVGPAERLLSGFPLDPSMGRGRPSRTAMAFSPDGRSIVFSAEREGRVQLYLRRLDQLEASPIAGTVGASNPFFSPDGQSLGFHAEGALKKVPLAGGPVVGLCNVDVVYGAAWGRTNQIVFARQAGGLWQVSAAGGTPTAITKPQNDSGEVSHRLPQLLPDGQTVLFTVTKTNFPSWDETQVVAQSLATGNRKVLIEGGADARFVATGHLIYLRRATLMAVSFDPQRLEVMTGAAVALVADAMQAASIQPLQIDTGAGQFAVSESGSLVYATGGIFPQDRWSLVWVDRNGRTEPLRVPPGAYLAPRISPDGKRVAFSTTTGDPALDRREQVSSENGAAPAWRRDGRELYYVQDASADGPLKIRMMAVPITTTPTFSAGAPRVLFEGPFRTDGPFRGYDVTPDGQHFLMVREIAQPAASLSAGACSELDRRAEARSAGEVALLAELVRRYLHGGR